MGKRNTTHSADLVCMCCRVLPATRRGTNGFRNRATVAGEHTHELLAEHAHVETVHVKVGRVRELREEEEEASEQCEQRGQVRREERDERRQHRPHKCVRQVHDECERGHGDDHRQRLR